MFWDFLIYKIDQDSTIVKFFEKSGETIFLVPPDFEKKTQNEFNMFDA